MCSVNPSVVTEYYVVFTSSKADNWMVRHIDAPFQHVYAVKKTEGGFFWVKINPMSAYTEVTTYPVSEYPHIRNLIEDDAVVLPVRSVIKQGERHTLCVINCVEVVKSLLGIRSFWTFTPWQLYKYLIKEGKKDEPNT